MTARQIIEAEDPKQFLQTSRDARYRNMALAQFCDTVQTALEELDSGNAEHWPAAWDDACTDGQRGLFALEPSLAAAGQGQGGFWT